MVMSSEQELQVRLQTVWHPVTSTPPVNHIAQYGAFLFHKAKFGVPLGSSCMACRHTAASFPQGAYAKMPWHRVLSTLQ